MQVPLDEVLPRPEAVILFVIEGVCQLFGVEGQPLVPSADPITQGTPWSLESTSDFCVGGCDWLANAQNPPLAEGGQTARGKEILQTLVVHQVANREVMDNHLLRGWHSAQEGEGLPHQTAHHAAKDIISLFL